MPDISEYQQAIQVILGESAKYFSLLVFAVLAFRLWRRLPRLDGGRRRTGLCLAGLVTLATGAIGYFSLSHSLSLIYSHYGMRAFRAGNVASALVLFQKSSGYWRAADARGEVGACLLLMGDPREGLPLLKEAKAMRHGRSTSFEQFYQGVFWFFQEQPDKAAPLLEAATDDLLYRWDATKLLAAIHIERNDPTAAARFMDPYLGVDVKESDQAYVMASIEVWRGRKAESRALLEKFPQKDLSEFWKPRFERLRIQAQD